ncbi:MAG: phosphatidylserine/phosphatidylglycerophosphate/cardiolipin synthase family protein [Gemmatimonadales bacterium]
MPSADTADPIITRALDRAAGSRAIPGNQVDLLLDGPVAYPAMLELIARARRWIHFENYIIRDDATGHRFADALIARARQGVHVRVLADWLGSIGTGRRFWHKLRQGGVEVRIFQPPSWELFRNFVRDHRKLVTADGEEAIAGGLCIGDEWTGDAARGTAPWRDTAVRVAGPAAAALDQAFARTWAAAGGAIPADQRAGSPPERGDAAVRVIAVEPGEARSYRMLQLLAAGAGERLWITDAYLVPPPPLMQGLIDAARDGTDVRLLVPGASDLPFIRNLTRIGYRDLLRAGIKILEWDGPMLHAKTFVVDGNFGRVGSSNLNASSLLGNYELDVLVANQEFATALEAQYRIDSARSVEITLRPVRAPAPLQPYLPPGIAKVVRQTVEPDSVGAQRPSPRERRGRTAVALRTVASAARRSLFAGAVLVLLAVASLALFLPRVVAAGVGLLSLYLILAAVAELFRRRRAQSSASAGR